MVAVLLCRPASTQTSLQSRQPCAGLSASWKPHASAAVLHDYLYATALMPREAADRLFLEAMTSSGVGRIKRRAMFAAVRLFGRFYWN